MFTSTTFLNKHYKTIKRAAIATSVLGLFSVVGVLYYYPELRNTPIGALKASHRLWNVTYAGIKIAWIYKKDKS